MGIHHVFHAVGNHVSARQGIQHAVMAHGNAIVHRNRIELFGNTASRLDLTCHELAQVFQMHMPWYKLREGIHNRNNRFLKISVFHARGTPQSTCTSHVATSSRSF